MRHIIGFFLALVVSAALFFGAGWGFSRFSALQSGQGLRTVTAWTSLHNVLPAVRRVSALATGLPGLALIGWSALVLLRGTHALTYIPLSGSRYATGFSTMLSSGVLLLLGMAMIIPIFLPSRWRGQVKEVEDFSEDYAATTALGLAP
jgi:hypothetical protein